MSEASIVFADFAGFTALTEVHGDEHVVALLERFYRASEQALADGARVVKSIGDAVMICAPTPAAALLTATRLRRAVAREPDWPVLRAGAHHGPVVERGGDCFGATVNVAARVAAHARAGQLLCTKALVSALPSTAGYDFRPLGELTLKNVRAPVPVYEVADESPPEALDIDPVCRMQVDRLHAPGRLPWQGKSYSFCSLRCAQAFAANPASYAGR